MAVSSLHEGLLELVRKQPALVLELLTQFLGIAVPEAASARLSESALAGVIVVLERSALDELLLRQKKLRDLIASGRIEIPRGLPDFVWFFSLLDESNPAFPIITPRDPPLPTMGASPRTASDGAVVNRTWQLVRPLLRGC
jgi:hypothetical protein